MEAGPLTTRPAWGLPTLASMLAVLLTTALPAARAAAGPSAGDQGAPRPAAPGTTECVVVEDFAGSRIGEFPHGWQALKEEGRRVYAVQAEGALRFLRAVADGLGMQAARAHEWDLDRYPVLAWSWRVHEFPRGADEQHGKNDSALGVYVLVPHSRVAGPRAVKYIWSETVPAGTRLSSNRGLTQVRVLRSGAAAPLRWAEERVNARDDYRAYFGVGATPRPAGIAVLTDADDTDSRARGDYAGFRRCRA